MLWFRKGQHSWLDMNDHHYRKWPWWPLIQWATHARTGSDDRGGHGHNCSHTCSQWLWATKCSMVIKFNELLQQLQQNENKWFNRLQLWLYSVFCINFQTNNLIWTINNHRLCGHWRSMCFHLRKVTACGTSVTTITATAADDVDSGLMVDADCALNHALINYSHDWIEHKGKSQIYSTLTSDITVDVVQSLMLIQTHVGLFARRRLMMNDHKLVYVCE